MRVIHSCELWESLIVETQKRKLADLRSHPDQEAIYGDASQTELEALAGDIEARGLRVPIEIDEQDQILDGHQRVRACRLLGRDEIDVHVIRDLTPEEAKERLIRANLTRRQLDPLAKARAIKALAELECARKGKRLHTGRNQEFRDYLAKQLGGNISGRTVDRYLRLITLDRAIQDAVSTGMLPMNSALKIASLGLSKRREIASRIAGGEVPKMVVAEYVRKRPAVGETPAQQYRVLLDFIGACADVLSEHAHSIVGTAMPHQQAADVLDRAIGFCEKIRDLEAQAGKTSKFAIGKKVGIRTSCSPDTVSDNNEQNGN